MVERVYGSMNGAAAGNSFLQVRVWQCACEGGNAFLFNVGDGMETTANESSASARDSRYRHEAKRWRDSKEGVMDIVLDSWTTATKATNHGRHISLSIYGSHSARLGLVSAIRRAVKLLISMESEGVICA